MQRFAIRAAAGAAILALIAMPAMAHDGVHHPEGNTVEIGDLTIEGAFVRATLPNAPVGGGYVTVTNSGDDADTLIGAGSPTAGEVQLHQMTMIDDVMRMNEVEGGIEIPAGESVSLAPGGLHLMFMQLEGAFEEGTTVPVTLTFENAGAVELSFDVRGAGAGAGADADHGPMDMEHGE